MMDDIVPRFKPNDNVGSNVGPDDSVSSPTCKPNTPLVTVLVSQELQCRQDGVLLSFLRNFRLSALMEP
jgi:hypothetical protein